MGMTSNQYQQLARHFACDTTKNIAYPILGAYEELGELIDKTPIAYVSGFRGFKYRMLLRILVWLSKQLGKLAKKIRNDNLRPAPFDICKSRYLLATSSPNLRKECAKELGDIEWMIANLELQYEHSSSYVQRLNITKLTKREQTNTIITHTDH